MTSCLRNQRANLCNGVSAPVTATQDALAERKTREDTWNYFYIKYRMMDNIEYG